MIKVQFILENIHKFSTFLVLKYFNLFFLEILLDYLWYCQQMEQLFRTN